MKLRHAPQLSVRIEGDAPLADLLNARTREPEFGRLRRLSRLFEQFHLKYTVTTALKGRHAEINGKPVINFGSANYLGLEQHPAVIAASKRALDEFGAHAGCSRVFSSHQNIVELEAALSALVGAEATLIGHNISQIHAGVLPALFSNPDSVLFLDRHAHTSMHQAALIAKAKGARIVRVDIENPRALEQIMASERIVRGALLVDGVYSMQGHIPDLHHLDRLCRRYGVILYVDDAHGVGVFGKGGGGVREACGLSFDNLLLVGSLQKAFGTYGGFLSGCAPLVDYLRVTSKAYIFSGTLQPSAVAGALESVRIARSPEGEALRARLANRSRHLRARLTELGFTVPPGDSPIVPVLIGGDLKTLMAGRKLFDLGIYLNSVLYPAVPRNRGILRISLTTLHSEEDCEKLLEGFRGLREYFKLYRNPLRQALHLGVEITKAKWHGERYAGL